MSLLSEVPDSIHITEYLCVPIIRLDTTHRYLSHKTRVNSTEIFLTQMVLHSVVQRIGQVVNTNQLKPMLGPAFLKLSPAVTRILYNLLTCNITSSVL